MLENLKRNMKKISMFIVYLLLIALQLLFTFDVITIELLSNFHQRYQQLTHQLVMSNVPEIIISDERARGNTQSNINNRGKAVETENYIFYITNWHHIYRVDKDFTNLELLAFKGQGTLFSSLNVLDDWLFYQKGKNVYRMNFDGSNHTRIFRIGYTTKMHFVGNWVYFFDYPDTRIYKMDINGYNRKLLNDSSSIRTMAIYEDRIFYSLEIDGEYFLRSMDFNGENRETIAQIGTSQMVVEEEYIFYVDIDSSNLCRWDRENEEMKIFTNQKVRNFSLSEGYLYYSILGPDQPHYSGRGLYRMDINGEENIQLSDEFMTGLFSTTDQWILYHSSENQEEREVFKRMFKDHNDIPVME